MKTNRLSAFHWAAYAAPVAAVALARAAFGAEYFSLPLVAAVGAAQAAFLWWILSISRAPQAGVIRFALRMEAQALAQFVTRFGLVLAAMLLSDVLWDGASWMDSATATILPAALLVPKVALAYAIPLAWWRCISLRRAAGGIEAVVDESFMRASVQLHGRAGQVAGALEQRLLALEASRTQRLARMFYHARMRARRDTLDGAPAWRLTWAQLPVEAWLVLAPAGPNTHELRVHCALRGGIHKLEVIPSPGVVLQLMRFLKLNLLQPLAGELTLAAALHRQDELHHQAVESQLRVLQAQVEPHFLFNTLANVRQMYRSQPDGAEAMMDHLIGYLRSTLDDLRTEMSTVVREMDLVMHYLEIMKVRMGDRLSYTFVMGDDVGSLSFPPAMLVSLAENAVIHGLRDKDDGAITISAQREDGSLRVQVSDNGHGFSSVQGSGVGLSNIRQRLEAIYGQRASLEVGALRDGGFAASIVLPLPE
ncbi:MAG TPA: histidine kinase [Telluria sp.]